MNCHKGASVLMASLIPVDDEAAKEEDCVSGAIDLWVQVVLTNDVWAH